LLQFKEGFDLRKQLVKCHTLLEKEKRMTNKPKLSMSERVKILYGDRDDSSLERIAHALQLMSENKPLVNVKIYRENVEIITPNF
jgi:hypothetical protein